MGQQTGSPHQYLFCRYNDHKEWRIPGRDTNLARPLRSMRDGDFTLVMEGDNPPELYNVKTDPGQWNNLAAGYSERVESMKKIYDDWYAKMKPQVIPDDHPLYGRYKTMQPQAK